MRDEDVVEEAAPATGELAVLLENHRAFLAFLERRIGDRATAEDILQEAFLRSAAWLGGDRHESVTAWFYRVLRNAIIDHYRRRGTADRAVQRLMGEMDEEAPPEAWRAAACQCVLSLAANLKPEYADALRRIDVEGTSVVAYAAASNITASNAGVRIFRARQALKREVVRSCRTCAAHGCLDCSCR